MAYDFYFDDDYEYMTEGYFGMEFADEEWMEMDLVVEGASMWRDYTTACWESSFFYDGWYDMWYNGDWHYGIDDSDFDMFGYDCVTYNWCMTDYCVYIHYYPYEDIMYVDQTANPYIVESYQQWMEVDYFWMDFEENEVYMDLYFDPSIGGLEY